MKVVEVTWLDAGCEAHRNMTLEEAKSLQPMKRVNVGYLVEQTKEKTIVCFGEIKDADKNESAYDGVLVIPSGVVGELKELK